MVVEDKMAHYVEDMAFQMVLLMVDSLVVKLVSEMEFVAVVSAAAVVPVVRNWVTE